MKFLIQNGLMMIGLLLLTSSAFACSHTPEDKKKDVSVKEGPIKFRPSAVRASSR